ncbi:MAG: SGNH/GDSL hydrolase family protein [Polyangiaceae bacterium]|nr:SGNH/GDSL hydrolase family protein [Polyangiaceae bacterium]
MRALVAAVIGLGLLGLGAPGRAETRSGTRYVVAAVGDSLTDTRAGGGKYLKALSERCPESRFDAYGVGGQRTDHMRWRLPDHLFGRGTPLRPRPSYTHVIILGGVNDLAAATPREARIDSIKRNLSQMYKTARDRGVSVVALTIPPWGRLRGARDKRAEATDALNDWIRDQAPSGAVDHAVDIHGVLSCGDPQVLCPKNRRFPNDNVHWGALGHQVVADQLYRDVFSDCR